jgi:hypothetical protein
MQPLQDRFIEIGISILYTFCNSLQVFQVLKALELSWNCLFKPEGSIIRKKVCIFVAFNAGAV